MLKFGMMGMSEGNGHPYSWSAIFNGYNSEFMKACPFPVIPEYLNRQQFPDDSIKEAKVAYVWTQDRKVSEHIAHSANIENIVEDYYEMVGKIDGLLLARDDAENHFHMALPFLESGIPIYIDKPLAYSRKEAEKILNKQKFPGQVFTCSALRFAKEFESLPRLVSSNPSIKYIEAVSAKSWVKYAIHVIDPIVSLLYRGKSVVSQERVNLAGVTTNLVSWSNGSVSSFTTTGQLPTPICIKVHDNSGVSVLQFGDTFFAFKAALTRFTNYVLNGNYIDDSTEVLKMIDIVERGMVRNER